MEKLFANHFLDNFKVVANENIMLQIHCGDTNVSLFARAGNILLPTQNWCPRHKNVSDFFQKHFASATNVSRLLA